MSSRKLPLAIIVSLIGVQGFRLLTVWGRLPERVASHFNHSGQPDGWSARESFLTLTLVEIALIAFMLAIPAWIGRVPRWAVNLPHRDYWLADERRAATLPRLGVWMSWFAVGLTVLLVTVNELIIRANLSGGPLPQPAHRIAFWGFLSFVALWLFLFHRAFRPPPAPPAPPVS